LKGFVNQAALSGLPALTKLFLRGLLFILLGYGVIGRGFAYLGFNPLFVGEIVFALGILAWFRSGNLGTSFEGWTPKLMLIFIGWSAFMTVPYIPQYGLMSLRDGVLWGYVFFAFIVFGVVVSSPGILRWMLLRYRIFAWVFLASAWAVWTISSMGILEGLRLPGSYVDLFNIKGGDQLVHLAGIAAFSFIATAIYEHFL